MIPSLVMEDDMPLPSRGSYTIDFDNLDSFDPFKISKGLRNSPDKSVKTSFFDDNHVTGSNGVTGTDASYFQNDACQNGGTLTPPANDFVYDETDDQVLVISQTTDVIEATYIEPSLEEDKESTLGEPEGEMQHSPVEDIQSNFEKMDIDSHRTSPQKNSPGRFEDDDNVVGYNSPQRSLSPQKSPERKNVTLISEPVYEPQDFTNNENNILIAGGDATNFEKKLGFADKHSKNTKSPEKIRESPLNALLGARKKIRNSNTGVISDGETYYPARSAFNDLTPASSPVRDYASEKRSPNLSPSNKSTDYGTPVDRGPSAETSIGSRLKKMSLGFRPKRDDDKKCSKDEDQLRLELQQMREVVKGYEKLFSELSDNGEQSGNLTRGQQLQKAEQEQTLEDLAAMELSYQDVSRRYNKLKGIVTHFKQNEEALKQSFNEMLEQSEAKEKGYMTLKAKANEMIMIANEELNQVKTEAQKEVATSQAQLKMLELKCDSLQNQIRDSNRENEELTKLCDELIARAQQQQPQS